jgi:hypothetical protein
MLNMDEWTCSSMMHERLQSLITQCSVSRSPQSLSLAKLAVLQLSLLACATHLGIQTVAWPQATLHTQLRRVVRILSSSESTPMHLFNFTDNYAGDVRKHFCGRHLECSRVAGFSARAHLTPTVEGLRGAFGLPETLRNSLATRIQPKVPYPIEHNFVA